ncbi:MAG: thioredoxin-like domain-containing protein [Pyrinomonadaceae bacterium]
MFSKRLILAAASLLLALLSFTNRTTAQTSDPAQQKGDEEMAIPDRGRVRAPELDNSRGWLNTEQPLSLAALRGKVVLLDFWTYGCINCIHIIPDLKRLEAKYPNNLVVIGVHSAKFENEKQTDNIRQIVLRYEIEHPIVNDADFRIWQSYAVRAWPTQVLIDPAGYVVGRVEGEGNYEVIDAAIAETLAAARKRGELKEVPLKLTLERAKVGDLPLAFPGKLLADAKTDRLYIADSNHNRIVVTKLDGTFLEAIGTGERGAGEGAFDKATFYRPQGLALDGDALYVADTENHLIRRVDLKARTVSTVAGTGAQARGFGDETAGPTARNVALNSPWDLQLAGRVLYIAMAGPHQIWQLDLTNNQVAVFAGSGREARIDGARLASGFAQPSGLTTDGRSLYVADSESNIIRAIDLNVPTPSPAEVVSAPVPTPVDRSTSPRFEMPRAEDSSLISTYGNVRTLAGGDLFEFGDVDGAGDVVRLQHPLGVLYADGAVFIADTYNHKIKRLDPNTRMVKTFVGTGRPGQADGASPSFYEPGGLAVANGKLYVADTNNHAVRVVDLATGRSSTLNLRGLRPPASSAGQMEANAAAAPAAAAPNAEEITVAPQRLLARAATGTALIVEVALPAGYHLNELAPQRLQVSVERGAEHLAFAGGDAPTKLTRAGKDLLRLPLRLPLRTLSDGAAELRVQFTLYYCREDNTGACRIKTLVWRAPIDVTGEATAPREIKVQGLIKG